MCVYVAQARSLFSRFVFVFFFFFNSRAPTEIYPLPLHDALPITSPIELSRTTRMRKAAIFLRTPPAGARARARSVFRGARRLRARAESGAGSRRRVRPRDQRRRVPPRVRRGRGRAESDGPAWRSAPAGVGRCASKGRGVAHWTRSEDRNTRLRPLRRLPPALPLRRRSQSSFWYPRPYYLSRSSAASATRAASTRVMQR